MAVSNFLQLLRTADRLLTLEEKHGKAIEKLQTDLAALQSRVTRLEAREDIVVAQAQAAAGSAASLVAMQSVADVSRRVGRLEERSELRRLEPPS